MKPKKCAPERFMKYTILNAKCGHFSKCRSSDYGGGIHALWEDWFYDKTCKSCDNRPKS